MRYLRLATLAALVATLVGCATPNLPAPPSRAPSDTHSVGAAEAIKQTSHVLVHLNADKSIVYSQNFGGGGVALGLLGPLGVAANVSMIESNTKADAVKLFDKVQINPEQLFREAAAAQQLQLQPAGSVGKLRLTPYLLITKVDETTLSPAAALFVEAQNAEGKPMTTKYMMQLRDTFSVDTLASIDEKRMAALRDDVRTGFNRVTQAYLKDSPQASANEPKIIFRSSLVTPRIEFDAFGSLVEPTDDVIWVRTFGGVFGLQKSRVTYSLKN